MREFLLLFAVSLSDPQPCSMWSSPDPLENPGTHIYRFVLGPYGQNMSWITSHWLDKYFFSKKDSVRIVLMCLCRVTHSCQAQDQFRALGYPGTLTNPYVWTLACILTYPCFLQGATSGLQHIRGGNARRYPLPTAIVPFTPQAPDQPSGRFQGQLHLSALKAFKIIAPYCP